MTVNAMSILISTNNTAYLESGDVIKLPVIFIHGFPFDKRMWENQLLELKDEYR